MDNTSEVGTLQFLVNETRLPFSALSDGFKAFLGWVWDLLYQIALVWDKDKPLTEMPGVVIVDEIDLFMHPEWQRTIVGKVAETFPNLQFLFSTHSPLVAGSLEPENVFVMETDESGAAVVKQYPEPLYGRSASEILTSIYFKLLSSRAPGSDNFSDLVEKAMGGDEAATREFLRQMTEGIPTEKRAE
jgi:predicted ATP-binding protein involved in virulence